MAFTVQDIQTVHSLRKNVRDPKIPAFILSSIESIHQCIARGNNMTKKVDWRDNRDNRDNRDKYQHANAFGSRMKKDFSDKSGDFSERSDRSDKKLEKTAESSEKKLERSERSDKFPLSRPQKYVSKFKKVSDKVEDTILNTILRGKLNKFSQSNYGEIKEFITHIIDGNETDMIKCFMKLVFEKAASEEIFCPLYAKLLSELSSQYPVLLAEMENLYTQYMEIFEEVYEENEENYNELCKRNIEKKYRRGYSQFLAELIKHDVIDTNTFMKIIMKIIGQVESNALNKDNIKLNEEFADCLMKIMKAIQFGENGTVQQIRAVLKGGISERIRLLSVRNADIVGLSNKARFTFLDLYEAVQKW